MSPIQPKKTRKRLTIKEKVDLIEQSLKGFKNVDLSRKFGVAEPTVSKIIKDKKSILETYQKDQLNKNSMKNKSVAKFEDIEESVYEWYVIMMRRNLPIDSATIREKAKQIAFESGMEEEFKASNGWVRNFQKRLNLRSKILQGEKLSNDPESAKKWLDTRLPEILRNYEQRDIFNCDETGNFFRALPDRRVVHSDQVASGHKVPKERISVLLCANMDGSEKKKALIIGKVL